MPDAIVENITFPSEAGQVKAQLARPRAAGRFPAITRIPGRNSVSPEFNEVGERWAEEGFVDLGIDWMLVPGENPGDGAHLKIIKGAYAYLRSREFVVADQLTLSGYCMGGGLTYLGLGSNPGYNVGIVWHGGLGGDRPEAALRIDVPLLIIHGLSDPGVPVASVFDLVQKLNQLGRRVELKVYSGTEHAFTIPGGNAYHPANADDAFRESVCFLRRTFGLPVGSVEPLVRAPVGV